MISISDIIEDYIDELPITYYYDKIIGNGRIDPYNYISISDYKEHTLQQMRINVNIDLEKRLFYEENNRILTTQECVDMIFTIFNSVKMNDLIEYLYNVTKTSSR